MIDDHPTTIDDPLGALEKQFENEQRASDPVLRRLADFALALPLPWPADKVIKGIVGRLHANRIERIELTLRVIREELRRHEDRLQKKIKGSPQDAQPLFQEWFALVEDGLKKAERTRSKERVERIGKILATSLVRVPTPGADDVEEMMRIAMELSDRDVTSLGELVRVQAEMLDETARVSRYQAWSSWPNGPWGARPDGDIESVFSKLESFGLVSRLAPPNNLNITAELQSRYGLLKKGLDFVRFVQHQ